MIRNRLAELSCLALLLVHCSVGPVDVAGGGSETETASIKGLICRQDSTPATDVQVALYSSDYTIFNADAFSRYASTDSAGQFHFDSLAANQYNILCMDSASGEAVLVPGVEYMPDTLIDLGHLLLQKTGALEFCQAPDSSVAIDSLLYVYIPGTPFVDSLPSYDSANGTISFSFAQIPSGTYSVFAAKLDLIERDTVFTEYPDIQINPDDTTTVRK